MNSAWRPLTVRVGAPVPYDAWAFNLFYHDWLSRSARVRLRRAYREIRKQGRRSIRVCAVKVPAHQVGGVFVRWKEDMVGSDMPDGEEAVSSIENCPTANLKAPLCRGGGGERSKQHEIGRKGQHKF